MNRIKIPKKELYKLQQVWKETFAHRIFEREGTVNLNGFAWHVFSGNDYKSVKGNDAAILFTSLKPTEYYEFDVSLESVSLVINPDPLEVSEMYGIDHLFCATDFSWTFATSHEYEYGAPFFATRDEYHSFEMLALILENSI